MRASERYIWWGIWRQLGSSTTRSQQRPLRGSAGVGRAYEGLSVGAKLDIMSDNFWANLVDETNLYADQHLAAATYVVSPLIRTPVEVSFRYGDEKVNGSAAGHKPKLA